MKHIYHTFLLGVSLWVLAACQEKTAPANLAGG